MFKIISWHPLGKSFAASISFAKVQVGKTHGDVDCISSICLTLLFWFGHKRSEMEGRIMEIREVKWSMQEGEMGQPRYASIISFDYDSLGIHFNT